MAWAEIIAFFIIKQNQAIKKSQGSYLKSRKTKLKSNEKSKSDRQNFSFSYLFEIFKSLFKAIVGNSDRKVNVKI